MLLRLVLWTILHMPVGSFVHLAPDCSSWGVPARGTSKRSYINPSGNLFNECVRFANQHLSRFLSYSFVVSIDWNIFGIPINAKGSELLASTCMDSYKLSQADSCDPRDPLEKHGVGSGTTAAITFAASSPFWMAVQFGVICNWVFTKAHYPRH